MSIEADEELNLIIEALPQKWFMLDSSKIRHFEKYAEGTPSHELLHTLLVKYFHLSGDSERCAFYALHGNIVLYDPLIKASIETACLDYIIYKEGGSIYGSACMPVYEDNEYNQTRSKTKTIVQEQRKPFELLSLLSEDKIFSITDDVVARSKPEAEVSWKVHSKTLKLEELDQMSFLELKMVFQDVEHHNDAEYRDSMLRRLLLIYQQEDYMKEAVECLIELRSSDEIVKFLISLINGHENEAPKQNIALQTAFNVFEEAPENIVNEAVFELKEQAAQLPEPQKEFITLLADKVLTGQISSAMYSDFVSKNYELDKVALRKLLQANGQSAEELNAYSLMLSIMSLSTQYYEHRGNIVEKEKFYPRFAHYAQIGLVYRGSYKAPQIFNALFSNFANSNAYELGGAIFGLALQFAGLNTVEAAPLALILDINDNELSSRNEEDRGPIIHGMAFALGLICLGSQEDEICEQLVEKLDTTDIDAEFSILLAIGLIMLGNVECFDSSLIDEYVKPYLSCEHEKLRRGSALCLSLLCYRKESRADIIVEYLENFAAQNQSQFSDTCGQFAGVALGLAYCQTNNIEIAQRLLLEANDLTGTYGAQFAVEAIGFVLQEANGDSQKESIFELVQMCAKSFDTEIRAGSCSILGQIFAATGDSQAIELLCKMMGDEEESVRCAAYVAEAMILQNIEGSELPESMTAESTDPVGDKQKNVIYRCDFESDEAFELEKAEEKLYTTPGNLSERHREIYINKHSKPFTVNEYATEYRLDLAAAELDIHDSRKETYLTVRSEMLALGLLNCGGLNMSFKQKTDLQIIAYQLYLQSWLWYPMMGTIGLCMECDYISTVELDNGEIQEIQLVLTIPERDYEMHGYSVLSKDTKHQDVEKYVKRARLSQNEMNSLRNSDAGSEIIGGYSFIKEMKEIAMQEFAQEANNVKLSEVLKGEEEENVELDEFKVLETPVRLVEEEVEQSAFIDGTDYVGVFPGIKRGIIVVKEVEE